jgi:ATP-dependent Clp protease ATP-binding subunit ClpC
VDKGWDPAMGARPLRRAIQRYIEDPLADEVLAQNAVPGSTVAVDRGPDDEEGEPDVKITITKPVREREKVGVGAEGGDKPEGDGGDQGSSGELPDDPDVLPDVPDAPPAPDGEGAEPEPGSS